MRKFKISAVITAMAMVMAMFTANNLNGQNLGGAITCPGIQTLSCTGTPNSPIPGTEYTYSVNVSPTGGAYTWFVTTDPNFISGGVLTTNRESETGSIILAAGTGYNDTVNGTGDIKITWEAKPTSGDVFLVMNYEITTPCASNNLKVFKIDIINNFAIDVYAVTDPTSATPGTAPGTTTPGSEPTPCPSTVTGATYDAVANSMVYDYGKTYLYYVIAAGNFTDAAAIKFKVNTTLGTGQTMAVHTSADGTGAWTAATETAGEYSVNMTGSGFVAQQCVVVRVELTNGTYESTTAQSVTLEADATTNSGNINDVATDCTDAAAFAKASLQTIQARPTVTATAGTSL
jgi:hypothetical protein